MGLPNPYRYVSLGFSSWKSSHIQRGLGYKEPRGGQCSTLGSQPIDDQLGPVLVSAEEDLQGAKVSAKMGDSQTGRCPGKGGLSSEVQPAPAVILLSPLLPWDCSVPCAIEKQCPEQGCTEPTPAGTLMWFREVLPSPRPAHRVPPSVTVLVLAAEPQPAPADIHQEDKAPVGDEESHGGALLALHVEEQPTGGVQLHLQGEMGPAGTGSDWSTQLSCNCFHVLPGHDPRAGFVWDGHGARLTSTQRRLGSHRTPSGCSGRPRSGRCPWLCGAGAAAGTAPPGHGGGPWAQACPAPTQCAPGNGVRGASLHVPAELSSAF